MLYRAGYGLIGGAFTIIGCNGPTLEHNYQPINKKGMQHVSY